MKRILLVLAFAAAVGSASAQTAQSPVPENAKADTRMNKLSSGSGSVDSRAAAVSGAAATARKRIEMDGYKDVHGLARGADGLWRGTAKRGGKTVEVKVDRAGRVAEQ